MPKINRRLNVFGLWLNGELAKRGITQQELCERVNISQPYLCKIMRSEDTSLTVMSTWEIKIKAALKDLEKEQ